MSITEKMTRNAERFRRRVDEIRRDWTRSEEAKRQDLEAALRRRGAPTLSSRTSSGLR